MRLVRRQSLHLVVVAEKRFVSANDLNPQRSGLRVLQPTEKRKVVRQLDRTQFRLRLRPERAGLDRRGLEELLRRADAASQAIHLLRRDVLDLEARYQREFVLRKGKVEAFPVLDLNRHAALDVELRPLVLEEKPRVDAAEERREKLLVQQVPVPGKHRLARLVIRIRVDVAVGLLRDLL